MTFLIGSCSPNRKTNPLTTKEYQAGKYESAAAQFRMHDIVFGNVPTKNGVPGFWMQVYHKVHTIMNARLHINPVTKVKRNLRL